MSDEQVAVTALDSPLHVGRPNIGNTEKFMQRVQDILERRWFTNNGTYNQEFEAYLCKYLGVKHCIPVCNGTVGLELLVRGLELSGEVIVPSFTFVATAHALSWLGVEPVFCDVDPKTHLIDVNKIEQLISPQTTAILAVHLWGNACAIEQLEAIAEKHGLKLIFDAAHALGSDYQGKKIGNFGRAEVFSFHATKFVNAFEGGAIATNDDELADKIRHMLNFGFAALDEVVSIGTNAKMTEICAAMGLTSLENVERFIAKNKQNYLSYQNRLNALPGFSLYPLDTETPNNFQYIVLEIDEPTAGVSRDQLVEFLRKHNVLARRYFYPGCHRMMPYKNNAPKFPLDVTESLCQRLLVLPNGDDVDDDVIGQLYSFIKHIIYSLGKFVE